jgi:hypothetical protein
MSKAWEYASILRYILYFFMVSGIGLSIEVIQPYVGRDFSWHDLISDTSAGAMVCWWKECVVNEHQKSKAFKFGLTLMTFMLVFIATRPLRAVLYDEIVAYRQFPLLSGFETESEMIRWQCDHADRQQNRVYKGKWALGFKVNPKGYSGCSFSGFPENWSGYHRFNFAVWSPEQNLPLNLRINDLKHIEEGQHWNDRFNKTFLLKQGWNPISVSLDLVQYAPKNRKMDMNRVIKVVWFVHNLGHPAQFYIDDVELK